MRPFVLGVLCLLLAGCVVYERHSYPTAPGPAPAPATRRVLSQDEAVDVGYRLCADRGLRVDRVELARLDASGRWHVTLAGFGDRAQMMLDGRDGKLLKGRFHRDESEPPAAGQAPIAPPPPPPPPPDDELD
jgi:hypothetical protein